MQNFPKISAIILVVGLVVSVYASRTMRQDRVTKHKIGSPTRQTMVYLPVLGFDKFYADIKWMQCVNEMGGLKGALDDVSAEYFYRQFDRITDLDPDFEKAYSVGASHLAYVKNAELALALVDKAEGIPEDLAAPDLPNRTNLVAGYAIKKDWNRSFLASHWIRQVRAGKTKDEKEKQKHYDDAIAYLNKAVATQAGPWYVESALLNTIAMRDGNYEDPYLELLAWNRYLQERIAEQMAMMSATNPDDPTGAPASSAPMDMMMTDVEGIMGDAMTRLKNRILNRCRSLMEEYVVAEAAGKGTKEITERKAKVKAVFVESGPSGHYSRVSLAGYGPGDLFDAISGTAVVPYGIDLYDLEVNGRITSVKGTFNTLTGKKTASSFPALIKLLGKNPEKLKAQYAQYLAQQKEKSVEK